MDQRSVRIAYELTLKAFKADYPTLEAKEITGTENPRYMERRRILADTLAALNAIGELLKENKLEAALYVLGGAHAVLWATGALTCTQIEEICREALPQDAQ